MRALIGKKRISVLAIILFMAICCLMPGIAGALDFMDIIKSKAKDAAAPLQNKEKAPKLGKNSFTILRIEPDTTPPDPRTGKKRFVQDSILLYFTDAVGVGTLRRNLKIIPPVPLQWHDTTLSDNNVLKLKGQFKAGQRYVIAIPEGYKSAEGKKYVKNVTTVTIPNLESEIVLSAQGSVIEMKSKQMLHLQLTNVDEVLFKGLYIPPVLIPTALTYSKELSEKNWEDIIALFERQGKPLLNALAGNLEIAPFSGAISEESQLFFSQKELNTINQFSMPLGFRKEKERGAIELIQIRSNKKEQDARSLANLFRITDIGLTYKTSQESLLVWATSLHSGKPLANVQLLGFTFNNEAVPLGATDAKGVLVLKGNTPKSHISLVQNQVGQSTAKPVQTENIYIIAAVMPNDQTFIVVNDGKYLSADNVQQEKRAKKIKKARKKDDKQPVSQTVIVQKKQMKGHVFTERGIYRPGETVYFKGTLREYHDGEIAATTGGKVSMIIMNSKGEKVYEKELALSAYGTVNDAFLTKAFFPLGTYTITMSFGKEESDKASRTFEVQEFRQPRHYVEIRYKRESKKDESFVALDVKKEMLNCEISGKYYAGGPVKHGKVRWSIYHTKSEFSRPDFPSHVFGYPMDTGKELIDSGESLLDEKGLITVSVPLSKDILVGKYGIEVAASVVDFDGRASSETAVYQGDPEYLIGISKHPATVQINENQILRAVILDKKGKKITSGSAQVQVMEQGIAYIQKRNADGQLYHDNQKVWRKQLAVELPVKNDGVSFEFDFSRGGTFLVTFSYKAGDGKTYTSGTVYSVPWAGYYDYEYNPDTWDAKKAMERLSLYTEKTRYSAGETIKLFINPGRPLSACLVTIEQNDVVTHEVVELKPGQTSIDIPVKNEFSPNVYISVLGTVSRSSFPVYSSQFDIEAPGFMYGTVNVEVKSEQEKIKIAVNEEQKKIKALPGSEIELTVSTTDQAGKGVQSEVALAVVDESILSMTGFETPSLDILTQFILPLGVFTGEMRRDILRQTPFGFFKSNPLTGGDGLEKAPDAVTSKIRKDFNPVAYFNPALVTDANGKAVARVKFPDTMTTYRIYAVACDKKARFGSYQRNALVVKDFYMEPGLPAFLTRGDSFKFSVSAFNKTETGAPAEFSLKHDEGVMLKTPSNAYAVNAFDRTLIPVDGTAMKAGTTQMQFFGKLNKNEDAVEIKLPVNSGHVLGTEVMFGKFRKEAKIKYALPKTAKELKWEDTGPDEVKVLLTVSGSPFVRMSQGLQYLLRYPYGCVEQTSSGVLPLAALRGIIQKSLIPDITIEATDKFLKPGIDRLFTMQTTSGGFGYWPGDYTPHKWGSIYALTAITRAKLAGLEIPDDRLKKGLAYLQEEVKTTGKEDATFRAFGAYILALNNTLDKETFNRVYETIDKQPREAAILVVLSGKLSGHLSLDTAQSKLRRLLETPWLLDKFVDVFYARYRDPAVSLIAAVEVLPGEGITDKLAEQLMGGIKQDGIWTSTSDTGWSLVALSAYFSGAKTEGGPASVSVHQDGKVVETFSLDEGGFRTIALDPKGFLKNPECAIASSTDQTMLYKVSMTFPRTDYSKNGYSNGFEVHKSIRNTDGSNVLKVGDIVEVKVKINIKTPNATYVVLDDPLPAGFVAINSAIKTEESIVAKAGRKKTSDEGDEGDEGNEGDDMEYGDGVSSADWYWDPSGYYRFTPNFFEIRNDRVLAFRNRAWTGVYEYSYYARAVCEGEFKLPSTKVQLMYDPEVVAYSPEGKVVIKGR